MYKSKYFTDEEISCNCGCGLKLQDRFLMMLDLARDIAEVPFIINSAARCVKHNKKVNGVANSAHIKGLAVDISIKWLDTVKVVKIISALGNVGFTRYGVNIANGFVHVDCDNTKDNCVFIY